MDQSQPSSPTKPIGSTTEVLSKRLGSLQAFQARIAQRIAQAQSQTQPLGSLLSIRVQDYRLLVPLTQINELLAMPQLTHFPLAKRWVLGLTVVRSEVLTVFDLAYCLNAVLKSSKAADLIAEFGSASAGTAARQADTKLVVLSKHVGNQLAFVADQLSGTVVPSQDGLSLVSPSDEMHALFADKRDYVKALWRHTSGVLHIELSLTDLLKSPDFSLIAN